MAKQSITVVLDEETIRYLAMLGKPIEVLEHERAEQRRYPADFLAEREATDTNLTGERRTSIPCWSTSAKRTSEWSAQRFGRKSCRRRLTRPRSAQKPASAISARWQNSGR